MKQTISEVLDKIPLTYLPNDVDMCNPYEPYLRRSEVESIIQKVLEEQRKQDCKRYSRPPFFISEIEDSPLIKEIDYDS